MTRRTFLTDAGSATAMTVVGTSVTRAHTHTDPIAVAARELTAAMNEVARLQDEGFDRSAWQAACDRVDETGERLHDLMSDRGMPAVIVDGRLYADNCCDLSMGLNHYPQMTTIVNVSDVTNLD